MTITITHPFVSPVTDEHNPTEVGPDEWNASHTISGTLDAAQMPALTGDVTTSAGDVATTLATVNGNVGTFGSATQASQVAVNAKGLVTAATNVTITPAASSVTGTGDITRVNDTNVTLTLGGTPTGAVLKATSITVGWSGTLAAARLNSNVVQGVTNDTNVTGSIAAQNLTLGWTGTLAAARLNANVVQSVVNDTNITGSIATQALTLGWTGTLALSRLAQGTDGQLIVGQTSAAALYKSITGDWALSAAGAATLATVNSNVGTFGSATKASVVTVNGKGLVTAASESTVTPAIDSVTGLAAGVATFLATPSSANLKTAVTDETGSGALVFANTPTLVTPNIGAATGTSATLAGSIVSTSPTAGIGYATGSGGTVTQATSKSTGVTLNTVCGAITMNNAALAAGAVATFTFTNSAIAATDVLVLNHISGGTNIGGYTLNAQCQSGSAFINIRNNTSGSQSEAIVLQFVVIKGVNA